MYIPYVKHISKLYYFRRIRGPFFPFFVTRVYSYKIRTSSSTFSNSKAHIVTIVILRVDIKAEHLSQYNQQCHTRYMYSILFRDFTFQRILRAPDISTLYTYIYIFLQFFLPFYTQIYTFFIRNNAPSTLYFYFLSKYRSKDLQRAVTIRPTPTSRPIFI